MKTATPQDYWKVTQVIKQLTRILKDFNSKIGEDSRTKEFERTDKGRLN